MEYENLRFLTRSYVNLQGLRTVPLGALVVGWKLVEPVWPKSNLRDTVQLALIVASMAGFILIGRYYKNRFGQVEQSGRLWGVVTVALGLIGYLAAVSIDSLNPPVSITAMFFASFFAGGAIESRGLRWHMLVPAGAFVVLGVLPMAGVVSVNTLNRPLEIAFGFALVFTGVLDHALLVRSLPVPADV